MDGLRLLRDWFISLPIRAEVRVALLLGFCVGIIAPLPSLFVILCRERVRHFLTQHGLQPVSIRLRFFGSDRVICRLRVKYLHPAGFCHRACIATPWIGSRVVLESDDILDTTSA